MHTHNFAVLKPVLLSGSKLTAVSPWNYNHRSCSAGSGLLWPTSYKLITRSWIMKHADEYLLHVKLWVQSKRFFFHLYCLFDLICDDKMLQTLDLFSQLIEKKLPQTGEALQVNRIKNQTIGFQHETETQFWFWFYRFWQILFFNT